MNEALVVVLFVLGVFIHQRFFAGRPLVPTLVGILSVSYIFNLIFGVITPPAQIASVVGRKTLEVRE
jgi:hypothetical protein